MMKTSQYFKAISQNKSDWNFVPPMLSGTTGIIIGLVIASVIGWV